MYHQCVHCVKQRYFIRSILTIVRSVCACKGKKKQNSSLGEEMNGYYRVLTLIIEAVVHSIQVNGTYKWTVIAIRIFKMRRRNTRSVEALLSASVCITVALLSTFLFLTYYQNSAALLMYDSAAVDTVSWTARCAAALFYLCGGFGIVYGIIVLLVCASTLIARKSWSDEWERLIALCVIGVAWSGISFLCHVDCISGCIPGGFFGYIIGSCAQYIVGVHMSLFFISPADMCIHCSGTFGAYATDTMDGAPIRTTYCMDTAQQHCAAHLLSFDRVR